MARARGESEAYQAYRVDPMALAKEPRLLQDPLERRLLPLHPRRAGRPLPRLNLPLQLPYPLHEGLDVCIVLPFTPTLHNLRPPLPLAYKRIRPIKSTAALGALGRRRQHGTRGAPGASKRRVRARPGARLHAGGAGGGAVAADLAAAALLAREGGAATLLGGGEGGDGGGLVRHGTYADRRAVMSGGRGCEGPGELGRLGDIGDGPEVTGREPGVDPNKG